MLPRSSAPASSASESSSNSTSSTPSPPTNSPSTPTTSRYEYTNAAVSDAKASWGYRPQGDMQAETRGPGCVAACPKSGLYT